MGKYLVTGSAGFIGAKVSEMLLAEGHTVYGIDNLNNAYDVRLKHRRLSNLTPHPSFQFLMQDICDREKLNEIFDKCGPFDGVINLAARAGVRSSVENPWIYFDTNVTGTLNLLEACRRHNIKKFVQASSSSLYGQENQLPYREEANTDRMLSQYAASKKSAEVLCYTYHHLYHMDFSIFRYFTVYGPAGRPDMSMFRFIQWIAEGRLVYITGDGTQTRDFTYVDDIARGTILGLKPVGYEIFNLGNDRPVALIDIVRMIESSLGKKANIVYKPVHQADVPATRATIARARRLLGWSPRVPIEEGIQRAAEWYLKERSWTSQVETE